MRLVVKTFGFDQMDGLIFEDDPMDGHIEIRGGKGDYEDPDLPKKTWGKVYETLFRFIC